ncbi:MAG TPA: NTP transferase domain-containing protein, partial [Terriglobales bacterium]
MLSPGLCGIILAAGESSRMGRDKALLPWPPIPADVLAVTPIKPSTILSSAIDALTPYCDSVIVVAGKNANALQSIVYARAG